MHLLSFPEELLQRILEEVVLYPSPSSVAQPSREAPSTTLGPSPIATPSATPKSSPSATRHVSPQPSPTHSRPSSPPSSSSVTPGDHYATPTQSNSSSDSLTSSTPMVSPRSTLLAPLLTCQLFSRIALPIYYRVVQLKSREQARLFLVDGLGYGGNVDGRSRGREAREKQTSFDVRRFRARWIRRLVLCGVWKEAGEVVRVLSELVSPAQFSSSINDMASQPVVHAKGKGKAKACEAEDVAERVQMEDSPISLQVLEITIDAPPPAPRSMLASERVPQDTQAAVQSPQDEDAELFADALRTFASCWKTSGIDVDTSPLSTHAPMQQEASPLRHIVLRKPQNVYLTQPRSRVIISALASVVESAESLDSAFVAFRISDDPRISSGGAPQGLAGVHHHAFQVQHMNQQQQDSTGPSNATDNMLQLGPITQLTSALASRPKLKTFVTMLPSVWNEAVLRVSCNEALERVILLGMNGAPVAPPIPSSNRISLQRTSPHSHSSLGASESAAGGPSPTNSTPGSPTSARRPRLAVVLPPNPVERVYAASTRDVNGFHPTNPNAHVGMAESHHGHRHGRGYGGGGAYVSAGTGLFMSQARKHEKLCDLLRSGVESTLGLPHGKEQMDVQPKLTQTSCAPCGTASGAFVPPVASDCMIPRFRAYIPPVTC